MVDKRKRLGRLGEKIAKNYLKKKGYRILALNYKKPWGEIDIISQKENDKGESIIIFIEVKTEVKSASQKFGPPEEKVDSKKQRKLIRLAQGYLLAKNYPSDTNWQIDVISIQIDSITKVATLKHIKNAVIG